MARYVRLLGHAAILQGEDWLEPPAGKTSALLYYLAYQGAWVGRDALVYLFWPDTPEERARQNLRRLLVLVRELPYAETLEAEFTRLRWLVSSDTAAFKEAIAAGRLTQAIDLYGGPLLEGYRLPQAPEFESWLELERQALHGLWRDAVFAVASTAMNAKRYAEASDLLEKLRQADPLDEEALRQQLEALHLGGQQQKALARFKVFQRQLEDELGGEPERATLELMAGLAQSQHEAEASPPVTARPREDTPAHPGLPLQITPFVGREAEKERLSQLLLDPSCRLLSVVGPGGMGKTRLVIEAARAQQERFKDGAFFVNLVPVASPELMVYAIGDAVGFSFFGQRSPIAQLLDFLKTKELLLVLDNLEHLLSGVELVNELLERAPNIKLLATSRERLHLAAEWVFDLFGLTIPDEDTQAAQDYQAYDAIHLFIQRALGTRTDFALSDENLPTITRICQLVRGMPLAIELAASWLRALTVGEVASEIAQGIFSLEASARDIPARHRSIRAVFDYSWQLLTEEEQQVLRKLSVFQGGFRRQAAAEVTGATLPILASLVDKSFLTFTPAGRYRRHPLVIQYTQERLAEHPEEKAEVGEKHSRCYLHFLKNREGELYTSKSRQAFEAIKEELPNLRAAWTWLIEHRVEEVKAHALVLERAFRFRIPEGSTFFEQAIKTLDITNPNHHVALGYVSIVQSFQLWSFARFEESYECARRSLDLLQPLKDTQGIMRAQFILGLELWASGDVLRAKGLFQKSLVLSRRHPESRHTAVILLFLASVKRETESFPQVKLFYEEAIAEVEPLSDLEGLANLKQNYGVFLAQHAFLEEGERLIREGLELARKANAPAVESGVLSSLALITYKLGEYEEAEAIGLEGVALAEKLHATHMAAMALTRLGKIALTRKEYPKAQQYLEACLQAGWQSRHLRHVVQGLFLWAELAIAKNRLVEAAELLGLLQEQMLFPAVLDFCEGEEELLLERLQEKLPTEELEAALERGRRMKLEEVVEVLLERL